MATLLPVTATGNQDIDGVMYGSRWGMTDLTYSFPSNAAFYGNSYGQGETQNNFQALNDVQRVAARKVFGMISSVANLSFTEVQETSTNHAVLRLARSDAPSAGWTYLPDPQEEGGDSWFNISNGWVDNPVVGTYGFFAFIHEILHGVGLTHGSDADGFGAMSPGHDSMEYSVTTYRSYVGASGQFVENEPPGYAQTLMMYDIAALQHMYGANFSANSGNTVYSWSPTTGQMFVNGQGKDIPTANRVFVTTWDGGGNDSYDLSNYTTNLKVDLRPGEWSTTSPEQVVQLGPNHMARGTVANALLYQGDTRSLIENAIGGSGNDQIIGNSAANVLRGQGGADRLLGLDGADTLIGGTGNDVLTGGTGRDDFVFNFKPSKTANLDRVTDFNVTDDRFLLENAEFTKVGKSGVLSKGAYWTGAKAHDASDRIMYDKKSGALYYDQDGTGHQSQVEIAQLTKGLKITYHDFAVI